MGVLRRFFSRSKDKISTFFRFLYSDYKDVGLDTIRSFKTRPVKSSFYLSLLVGGIYSHNTNPSESLYYSALTEANLDIGAISASQRNEDAAAQIARLYHFKDLQQLRHLDLIFFSVIWRADFAKSNATYQAVCKHLKPHWTTWLNRVEDVGSWNRFHKLEQTMENYDVNEEVIRDLKDDERTTWQLVERLWTTTLRRQYTS